MTRKLGWIGIFMLCALTTFNAYANDVGFAYVANYNECSVSAEEFIFRGLGLFLCREEWVVSKDTVIQWAANFLTET